MITMHALRRQRDRRTNIMAILATARRFVHPTLMISISPTAMSESNNKCAQSHLERGPRRGAVAHVRRKVPIGYNGEPQMYRQKYPFPWTDRQTQPSASSLDPSDLQRQTASGSDPWFIHNALDRQTDRPTDRSRESLTTTSIGRCATRATRHNNNSSSLIPTSTGRYFRLAIKRSRVRLLAVQFHIMTLGNLCTQTSVSVVKQYNLTPATMLSGWERNRGPDPEESNGIFPPGL